MILREIIVAIIICSCLSPFAAAQRALPTSTIQSSSTEQTKDFSEIVVPITSVRFTPSAKLRLSGKLGPTVDMNANFGTGFCLDAACRFIATNYHVAVTTRATEIKGEKVIQRYFATGPQDKEATANSLLNGQVLPYTMCRDLAVLELRRSLRHHHGVGFSLDDLESGHEVDIYAYPHGIINPIRKLQQFHGTYEGMTASGLLAFNLSPGKAIRGGASGGIVVDRNTQRIVGILNAIGRNDETIALAVPVQTLADFVSKVQPFLAQKIFPTTTDVSPVSADVYSKLAPTRDHNAKFVSVHVDGLQRRLEEPAEVKLLRKKAQLLADSMRNFIAVQTFEWGSGEREPSARAEYEVRVIDGNQRFREHPEGKKDLEDVPFPSLNNVIRPGGEWSELPGLVGTELRLKIHQAADVMVNERRMKVFQYGADPEDGVCRFKSISDFVFMEVNKVFTVACYGEIWTDEDSNILRISEHYELPGKWRNYLGVVTYGWLQKRDEPPRVIPLTIYAQAESKGRVYWCRGQFTDYRVFDSRVKIIANDHVQSPPQ